jgi:hypothetical protein
MFQVSDFIYFYQDVLTFAYLGSIYLSELLLSNQVHDDKACIEDEYGISVLFFPSGFVLYYPSAEKPYPGLRALTGVAFVYCPLRTAVT